MNYRPKADPPWAGKIKRNGRLKIMENFEVQKNREEIISDVEIRKLHEELENMKKEAEQKAEEYKTKKENFPNDELVGLDFDRLVKSDWFLYKLYKEGKLSWKILSYHRNNLGMETTEILEKAVKKGHPIDYTGLPREQYLAWLGSRFVDDEARKKLEEKHNKKKAA